MKDEQGLAKQRGAWPQSTVCADFQGGNDPERVQVGPGVGWSAGKTVLRGPVTLHKEFGHFPKGDGKSLRNLKQGRERRRLVFLEGGLDCSMENGLRETKVEVGIIKFCFKFANTMGKIKRLVSYLYFKGMTQDRDSCPSSAPHLRAA